MGMPAPITDQEISAVLNLPAHLRIIFQPFIDRIKEQDETITDQGELISTLQQGLGLQEFAQVVRGYDAELNSLGISPDGDCYNDLLNFMERYLGIKTP